MPVNSQQLPHQFSRDAISGANNRATQGVFSSMPRFETQTFDSAYVEPMALNVAGEEPQAIELVRITNLLAPESPVLCGSMCHWVFRPDLGGALILSIDGLTSAPGSRYRFVFRITYKAQV